MLARLLSRSRKDGELVKQALGALGATDAAAGRRLTRRLADTEKLIGEVRSALKARHGKSNSAPKSR